MKSNLLAKMITPGGVSRGWVRWCVLILLGLSLAALIVAPLLMPAGYSWLTHTTSESAAQGLAGAWLARLGFLLMGLAVLWLSAASVWTWGRAAVWAHITFGIFLVATAVFSHRPFIEGVPYDPIEDSLHSITATGMGFAFALGVLVRFFQRPRKNSFAGVLDLTVLAASIIIPLIMAGGSAFTGLVQRVMFVLAYVWYGYEACMLKGAE